MTIAPKSLEELQSWQAITPTLSDTQVSDFPGTVSFQELEQERVFLSALLSLCATHSCDLAATGPVSTDGTVAVSLHMKLNLAQVFAFFVNARQNRADCNVFVNTVNTEK